MGSFISTKQYDRKQLEVLFYLAKDIKTSPSHYKDRLKDKIVATLFFEPSTRTRLSFEASVIRLGGAIISTDNASECSSARKGESLEDTIRVVEGYADCIVMRSARNDASEIAGRVSSIPIINAGSGSGEHPTQALLDMYTIWDKLGHIDGIKIIISGDLKYNRAIYSLLTLLSLYHNIQIYGLSKPTLHLPQGTIDFLEKSGVTYYPCSTYDEIPADIDIWYHTRIQKERFSGLSINEDAYVLDESILNTFPHALLLHPLPRIDEIKPELDQHERSVYFEQAHNGIPVRMALLIKCML